METNVKINLSRNKPKYSSNIGESSQKIYTPGEIITEQSNFMRYFLLHFVLKFTNLSLI